ncbi:hypothetical protein IGB42_00821 [Andreprevotia sp. IGB-42]|uniref:hypothetical protein n=1 Tax=Andreprevotia sp. IGB-42 TaxID=2497473 RepID=UPI0013575BE1|nr:hypothetical protein [Andreprevotia sp. IGB-42]KAF0814766.1 hypothetical protein IGB42_00821 [Andreprevotia sp. IGB-42]
MTAALILLRRRQWLEMGVLAALLLVFVWQLGSYPGWFDHIQPQSIWPQVNRVLDDTPYPLQGWAGWRWQDMYQHNAGLSPLYGSLIELGLRQGGMTLGALRWPQAIFSIIALCLAYFALRRRSSLAFAITLAVLLGTSPWFLVMMRSGVIIGFGGALLLVCLSLVSFLFPRLEQLRAPWPAPRLAPCWLAALAGFSVSLLPYAHTSVRLLAVLLALGVPLCYRLIGKKQALAFVAGLLPLLLVQLGDLHQSLHVYFLARGESLLHVAREQGSAEAARTFVISKVLDNMLILGKLLLGLNEPDSWFSVNLAFSYWLSGEVLYPKFLVPFFLAGLLRSGWLAWRQRSAGHLLLLLWLGITVAPGLMSGIGSPNQARLFLAVFPLYALITIGLLAAWQYLRRWQSMPVRPLAACLLLLIALYQVHNFFGYEKGGIDEKPNTYAQLRAAYDSKLQQCPHALFVLHEYPEFMVYSYVTIRWFGGPPMLAAMRSGQTWLLDYRNAGQLRSLLPHAAQVVVISQKNSAQQAAALLQESMVLPDHGISDEIEIFSRGCP